MASLGIDGSGVESGLLTARQALDAVLPTIVTHNAGFLRPEADLALVILSDEEDCSRDSYESNPQNDYCYQPATLSTDISVASLVGFFAGLKDSGVRKVRGALIAGGVKAGESNADFMPAGCRIANGAPSADCACWSSAPVDFACTYPPGASHLCTTNAGCSAPKCEALAATRYHDFMNELRTERLGVGFSGGTYEDSICQPEYDQTLLSIAHTVVLSNCFDLESPIEFPDTIQLTLRHTNDVTGVTTDFEVPRCTNPADCGGNTCSGALANGAWLLIDPKTICLECGLKKGAGDDFLLTALTEMVGIDGGTP